jgi:hypothetical protein
MLRRSVSRDCEFDQLHLLPWGSAEGDQFLSDFTLDGKRFPDPKRTYEEIVLELGDDQHPMLARPFLLAHVARGLLMYELSPSEFIRGMQDPLESVASVVKAFVDREVTHKWKAKDTGEPYLTAEQHMDLLANVAEEMWQSQVDRLDVDLIEAITATLLEEWKIEQERQRQIFEMVRMHVLLTVPTDGNARQRSFDHPEFRSYFIAMGLSTLIAQSIKTDKRDRLSYFLSIGQLPDSVARYACVVLNRDSISRNDILQLFTKALKEEWRPTFLQGNIGILVPQLLAVLEPTDPVVFDAKIPYTGLVFEGTHLRNITFEHGTFARVNFTGVSWTHVKFRECEFHEITIDEEAVYDDVSFVSCKLQGLRIRQGDGEERREYSPSKISLALKSVGIQTTDGISGQVELSFDIPPEGDRYKCARKLIRTFLNATSVSDHILSIKFKGQYLNLLQDEILPLLMEKGLIRHEDHHGGGPVQAKWRLELSVEDILAADGDPNSGIAQDFWREVASRDLSR